MLSHPVNSRHGDGERAHRGGERRLEEAAGLGLDREALLRILHSLLLTRRLDERGHVLYKQGRLPGSFYTCKGNEGASVGVAAAMRPEGPGRAAARNLGVHLSAASSPGACSASTWGASAGRPTAATRTCARRRLARCRIIAAPSHLPSILPVAVGAALAFRIRGEQRVALGWMGDGATANGTAHKSINFAGVRRLPVVFIIDNNQFAYSTPTYLNFASTSLAARGPAYGVRGHRGGRHRRAGRLPRGAGRDRARAFRAAGRRCSSC